MNKAVVTLRDWVGDLDRDSLKAVRRGEEALRDIYDDALTDWAAGEYPEVSEVLTRQYCEIGSHIENLPQA